MPDGKNILVVTIDPAEAAFRLRLGILAPLLADDGFAFDFRTRPADFDGRRRLLATAGDYHAVVVQRKLLDPSHARLLRRRARRVIYDLDDAVMVQRRRVSRWSQWLKDRRFRATAAAADHVVAGNEYLAEKFRALGRPATVLPTVVDPDHYEVKRHAATSRPTLVWIGSRSTLPYVQQWMPQLEAAARLVPGLRLLTVANDTVRSDVVAVEHEPWTEAGEAAALVRGGRRHRADAGRPVVGRQERVQDRAVHGGGAADGRVAGRGERGHRDRRRDRAVAGDGGRVAGGDRAAGGGRRPAGADGGGGETNRRARVHSGPRQGGLATVAGGVTGRNRWRLKPPPR